MATPSKADTLRWLLDKEANGGVNDPNLRGASVFEAAQNEGFIDGLNDAEGFAATIFQLESEGRLSIDYILLRTDQGPSEIRSKPLYHLHQIMGMSVTVEGQQWLSGLDASKPKQATRTAPASEDLPRSVMVVHGRNDLAREAVFEFLKKLGLKPLSWNDLVRATRKASPYIGEVLDVAFEIAGASVVIFTPDDEARLRRELQGDSEPPHETDLTPQARPNVIYEAGMAMATLRDRTIFLKLGTLREFSDTHGRHDVRVGDAQKALGDMAERLETIFGKLDRAEGWDDSTKLEEAMKFTTGIDPEAEAAQDADAVQDLNDDMRRWLRDRDKQLEIEMKTISNTMGNNFNSGAHVARIAAVKAQALHEYRDELTRKRREYRERVRGLENPPRFTLDDASRAILASWRADADVPGVGTTPVEDPTAHPDEQALLEFEEHGDPLPNAE